MGVGEERLEQKKLSLDVKLYGRIRCVRKSVERANLAKIVRKGVMILLKHEAINAYPILDVQATR